MYKRNYMQATEMADRIASGEIQAQRASARKQEQAGIMARLGDRKYEKSQTESPLGLATDYISILRERLQSEEPMVEEGIDTQALEEVVPPSGQLRPRARPTEGEIMLGEASSSVAQGYPVSQKELESIIAREARLRNIDPTVAVAIFRHEGAGAYQSQIKRSGKGSLGGKEASFGPFQLYTGGGLGNQYQEQTGRDLTQDNSLEGLEKQIQFSLDAAVNSGWSPWYGRIPAGVSKRQGLDEAKAVGNWRNNVQ